MLTCILTLGTPGSGKSTWAINHVAKDPDNWCRINNDQIRQMLNGGVWSSEYEKLIRSTRLFLIREAFKRNRNVIVDNVNAGKDHWKDVCGVAKKSNKDVQVFEKTFYVELDEAILRDSKREGKAKVGQEVVTKFWKKFGGKQFQFYKPRKEIYLKVEEKKQEIVFNKNLSNVIISDLDGTLAIIGDRNPYDASKCEQDIINIPVVETVKALYDKGYKIIFVSGREDKFKEPTISFIQKHLPGLEYQLFMRKSGDFRKDSIVKEEIYNNEIYSKYNVLLVLDDRTSVVSYWRSIGLSCFQVAPGDF